MVTVIETPEPLAILSSRPSPSSQLLLDLL
jgi:hypothetical protein